MQIQILLLHYFLVHNFNVSRVNLQNKCNGGVELDWSRFLKHIHSS